MAESSETATVKVDIGTLVDSETQKNKHKIVCNKCSSYILQKNIGTYINKEVDIPLIRQQKNEINANKFETEKLNDFWLVSDMLKFENIGFTNTVDNND